MTPADIVQATPWWHQALTLLGYLYACGGAMAAVASLLQGLTGDDPHRAEDRTETAGSLRHLRRFVLLPAWAFVSWPWSLGTWWVHRHDENELDPDDNRIG